MTIYTNSRTVAAQNCWVVETIVESVHDGIMIVWPYSILLKTQFGSSNYKFSSLSFPCCPDFTFSFSNTVLTAQATHRYNKFYLWMDKVGIYLQM